ncbi:MAG: c-type cytochrome [Rhodobacteraceae bacterium]|nr:MAG: c-type cytochrome [Paracoccaceae bacterium]
MKILVLTSTLALGLALPALAESPDPGASGDAARGREAFAACQTCHVVATAQGEVLAGKRARTGPNLHGVAGRAAGARDDFRYGRDLVAAGAAGMVFDEATFVAYVMDPKESLRAVLGNDRARSKMSYRVREAGQARDLYAFLLSLSPPEDSGS